MLRTLNFFDLLLGLVSLSFGELPKRKLHFSEPLVSTLKVQRNLPPKFRNYVRQQVCRSVILAVLLCTPANAQQDAEGVVRFAPGATGAISQDLVEMMRRAKEDASDLKKRLSIQGPMSTPDYGVDAARDAALKNPHVLELLGVDGATASAPPKDAWINAQAFVFASFSMPDAMLREVMISAHEMGLPVLFRGFYENDLFKTNDALMRVFGSAEDIKGFSIDPTLFRHFDVNAVPTYVLLKEPYEMCETQACFEDAAPPHDKISGSITLSAALEIFERGEGAASLVATRLLEEVRK